MSNLNKFGITEAQMLVLANKCELPYQFGSNWMAKFLSYSQELLALAAPVASAAPSGELHAKAINALLAVATAAYDAMDNCEERASATGGEDAEYIIQGNDFEALSTAMDAIDALPDDRPDYTLSGGARASWALRGLFSAAIAHQPPKEALTDSVILDMARNFGGLWTAADDDWLIGFARAISAATAPNKQLVEALRNFTDGCSVSVDAFAVARAALAAAGEAQS